MGRRGGEGGARAGGDGSEREARLLFEAKTIARFLRVECEEEDAQCCGLAPFDN